LLFLPIGAEACRSARRVDGCPTEGYRSARATLLLDDTERRLLYVACIRDHLLVTGVAPVSECLDDLTQSVGEGLV
jgi:hypothetical protein